MRRRHLLTLPLLAALSACAVSTGPSRFAQGGDGEVLTTPQGMTLYVYDRDRESGVSGSSCTGRCADMFPPFIVTPDTLARARKAGIFAPIAGRKTSDQATDAPVATNTQWNTVRRPDGTLQWTYFGEPLYTYHRDLMTNERNGDHLYGLWNVARPENFGQ